MLYHVVYYKSRDHVDDTVIEQVVRQTRSHLLKIQETLSVRSGKNLDASSEWTFFYSVEVESKLKLKLFHTDGSYLKFLKTVVEPNLCEPISQTFELDPSRERKYS